MSKRLALPRALRALVHRPRIVFAWLLLSLCVPIGALAIADHGATPRASAASHPFAQHLMDKQRWFTFEGTVQERLRAGPYVYLRIASGDREVWVVGLAATVPGGRRVRVTALGQASSFRSARLGREFDGLLFGIVRPLEAAPR